MTRSTRLLAGLVSLLLAAGFGFVAVQYLSEGAGGQFVGPLLSTETVLFGWIQLVGLLLGCGLSFLMGIWWCADGLVSNRTNAEE
jgi:hypothetical protein